MEYISSIVVEVLQEMKYINPYMYAGVCAWEEETEREREKVII